MNVPESTVPPTAGTPAGTGPTTNPWRRHLVSVRETRKGTLFALMAWVFAVYDFILFGTLLPALQADFTWSAATATGVATLISIGTAFVVLGVGPLVDRLGRRRGMLITVAGTAVASGLTALTFNPAYLVAVRSLGGLGLAEQSVNTTYLNEIYAVSEDAAIKKRRGFVYSIVQGGWPLGTLLAAAFAALLLPVVGWRGCFLLATFPAIVILLLRRTLKETPQFQIASRLRTLVKEGRTEEARSLAAEYELEAPEHTPLRQIFAPAARRNTIALSLAWIFNWFGIQVFSVLGTSVLVQAKGVDFASALGMFIIINVVAFTGYLFHGWAGDRFGRRNVIVVGWFVSTVAFTLMLTLQTGTVMTVVLYSMGMFFLVGPYAALLFLMGECYDTDCRATGATFLGAMSQPGAIVAGITVTALLAAGTSWSAAALWVGAGGILVSTVAMLFCRRVAVLESIDPELVPVGATAVATH
ncbi:MFS transporter [Kineococcus gynurae]|uniref:MFS transporter n=1 Tax=Kineococcus gynurae TaxID=452979 RepID=A0ABV5LUM2_9ACTN